MKNTKRWMPWFTRVSAIAFATVVVTGLLMICEIRTPFVRGIHGLGAVMSVLSIPVLLAFCRRSMGGPSRDEAHIHASSLPPIVSICMHCRRVRDGEDSWRRIEEYLYERTRTEFSHGLCPECVDVYYQELRMDRPLVSGEGAPSRTALRQ